jgi:hypothetical protein
MSADRVSLRVFVTRDVLREIDRRATASCSKRETIGGTLIAQALGEDHPANVTGGAEHERFMVEHWRDAVEDARVRDALLKILDT